MTEHLFVARAYANCDRWGERFQSYYENFLSKSDEELLDSMNGHYRSRSACVTARFVNFQALLSALEDLDYDLSEILNERGTVGLKAPFTMIGKTIIRLPEEED